jgi:RNA-splicing ligase RtcB
MNIVYTVEGRYATAKVFNNLTDANAIGQLIGICNELITQNTKVALMPDGHFGAGVPIGTTIKLPKEKSKWRISPTIISGDIGCGMLAIKIKQHDLDFKKLDDFITKNIPNGAEKNTKKQNVKFSIETIAKMTFNSSKFDKEDVLYSLGSLGGGNHFIEIDKDKKNNFWLVIHCGSRHVGIAVLKAHMAIAKQHYSDQYLETLSEFYRAAGREKELEKTLKAFKQTDILTNIDYAFLQGTYLEDYLHDVKIAQAFASKNREIIANQILKAMNWTIDEKVETIHNYFDYNDNTLRKGATSAHHGQKLIIPLNMRDGALICYGRGNEDWNYSAPHGAGRKLTRSEAKEKINLANFKDEMSGIYTTSVETSTIDEAPEAYKPTEQITETVGDTVRILDRVKPVYNFKAH